MTDIPDVIPVDSTTDWSAAFGFTNNLDTHDDDLGMTDGDNRFLDVMGGGGRGWNNLKW